jgi:hypothetical protein
MSLLYSKIRQNRVNFRHKKAPSPKIGFISVSGQKTLIFRHVAVFLDGSLHPPGLMPAEVAQVLSTDVLGPHLQDSSFNFGTEEMSLYTHKKHEKS